MSQLTLKDAVTFYKRYYAPNNAVLVVAGDVTPEELRPLAQATYGRNKPNKAHRSRASARRSRRHISPACAVCRTRAPVRGCCCATTMCRATLRPPGRCRKPGVAGLDRRRRRHLARVSAPGAGELASTAGTNYLGAGLDSGRMAFLVIPAADAAIDKAKASSTPPSPTSATRA